MMLRYTSKGIFALIIGIIFNLIFIGQSNGQGTSIKSESTTSGRQLGLENQPFELKHAGHLIWQEPKIGEKTAILSGKVHLELKKDQVTIMADTVWYYSISSVYKAAGHVIITKIDERNVKIVAVSQRANYNQSKNQIILEGNPKINKGHDELIGDVLVITSSDQGTTLEGENVQGVLYPEQKQPPTNSIIK